MRKCFMVKAPWIFNTLWAMLKGFLAARTLAKISVCSSSTYMAEIKKEIHVEMLPSMVGGQYNCTNEETAFPFDLKFLLPEDLSLSTELSAELQILTEEVLENAMPPIPPEI